MGTEWVLLIPDDGNFGGTDSLTKLLAELRACLKTPFARMGVSDSKPILQICEGNKEAARLLDIGTNIQPEGPLYRYENLGMYPIVHPLGSEDSIKNKLCQMIEPLYVHDLKNKSRLRETLEVFLQYDGNIKETAAKLFCHYNFVLYRLEKIQRLLNLDLKERSEVSAAAGDARLRLYA